MFELRKRIFDRLERPYIAKPGVLGNSNDGCTAIVDAAENKRVYL